MRTRCVEEPFARDTFLAYRRPTGSNPFHQSRGPLAAILALFPRRFQLSIPLGLNLLLMPGEHARIIPHSLWILLKLSNRNYWHLKGFMS